MNSLRVKQLSKNSARSRRWTRKGFSLFSVIICLSMILALVGITPALAVNPAPVQIFYVTLPEADGLTALDAINTAANSPMYTYFSIAIGVDGTYVYYDQWESGGYAANIANPTPAEIYNATTNPGGVQIWGNGLAADGCAPNIVGVPVTCTDGNDVLNAGDVIVPYNSMAVPRVPAPLTYVLDSFSSVAYNNNNGNTNWSTNWDESGDNDLPGSGDISITNGTLFFASTTDANDSIERGASLANGDPCATLSFDLIADSDLDPTGNDLVVEGSSDGGGSFTTIATFNDENDDGSNLSYPISAYASASSRIRFRAVGALETGEDWAIDNVRIDWNCSIPVKFDGKDKVGASSSIAMARATWATGSGTLNAFGHEMYATAEWGLNYEAPVGQNTGNAGQMFEYSALSIMASQNNTTVQVDADANGSYELSIPLQEGGATLVPNIQQGARVLSDRPVQVLLVTGDIGSNYASRDMNLLPTSAWGSSYWSPVGENSNASYPTRLYLYNLSTNGSIYITCERYGVANTTLGPVAASGVTTIDLATGQGAHCFASDSGGVATSDPIFAIGTIDTTNTAYDWSFTLYPDAFLTTDALVGLGLGKDPNNTTSTENGGPLWVTAACDSNGTYVYVDWDNDGTADPVDTDGNDIAEAGSENGILVNRLQSVRLFEPNGDTLPYDQTGARVWSRTASGVGYGGTPGCKLALAWGEDPANATAGSPGLDVGTSVSPLRLIEGTKTLTIYEDTPPTGGVLNPGDTVYYDITIYNAGSIEVDDVYVYDTVPANTSYVLNSTEWNTTGVDPWTPIADVGGTLPLAQPGGVLLGDLGPGETFYVRFRVTLLPGDYEDITNCDTAYTGAGNFTRCVTTPVATRDWGDLPDTYGTSAAQNGPRHSYSGLILGAQWDVEVQGQPSANANGDDLATSDDEDGITRVTQTWSPGATVDLSVVVAGGPGVLGGWFDWNNDGDISDAGEFVNFGAQPTGTNIVPLTIHAAYSAGASVYARFRLFDPTGIPGGSLEASDYLGYAAGGEVEDYLWNFFLDWGDLPDSYATLLASNGPRHSDGGLYLGANWDAEGNGQPTSNADGDDLAGTPDDEDSVTITFIHDLAGYGEMDVVLRSSNILSPSSGTLAAWFDWNGDGDFGDAGEANFYSVTWTGTETQHFNFNINLPITITDLYYRVRLFEGTVVSPLPTGYASNGEVEDYYWDLSGPTAATVSDPAATADAQSIQISWVTFDEMNILGFRLSRSTDPSGQVRQLIYETPALYRGSQRGATYTFADTNIQLGVAYTYWLEVLQKDGSTLTMDPITANAVLKIYLPTILR